MYNPFDPTQVDDHDEVLATLRREQPVAEVLPGVFYVSRYADVLRVLHDPIAFPQGGLGAVDGQDHPLDERALFELDPPEHTAIRRRFSTALSPKRIGALEPAIRAICSDLVDRFGDRSTVDIVAELGVPLPSLVVGQLAGFDESEAPAIRGYCDAFVRAVADPAAIDGEGIAQCTAFETASVAALPSGAPRPRHPTTFLPRSWRRSTMRVVRSPTIAFSLTSPKMFSSAVSRPPPI